MSFFDPPPADTSPPAGDSISARLTAVSRNILGTGGTTPRSVLAEEGGRLAGNLPSSLHAEAARGKSVDCHMFWSGRVGDAAANVITSHQQGLDRGAVVGSEGSNEATKIEPFSSCLRSTMSAFELA